MEAKMKHLEMIEAIIERLGNNGFQLKGWAVTLITIIGALAARETDRQFFLLAFIPLVAFWVIDSYYLQSERKYRELYRAVSKKQAEQIDFSMDVQEINVDYTRYKSCIFSKTEIGFYGSLIIAALAMAIILKIW